MRDYNPLSFSIGRVEVIVITQPNEGKFASGENFMARQSHKSCQKNNNFQNIAGTIKIIYHLTKPMLQVSFMKYDISY